MHKSWHIFQRDYSYFYNYTFESIYLSVLNFCHFEILSYSAMSSRQFSPFHVVNICMSCISSQIVRLQLCYKCYFKVECTLVHRHIELVNIGMSHEQTDTRAHGDLPCNCKSNVNRKSGMFYVTRIFLLGPCMFLCTSLQHSMTRVASVSAPFRIVILSYITVDWFISVYNKDDDPIKWYVIMKLRL